MGPARSRGRLCAPGVAARQTRWPGRPAAPPARSRWPPALRKKIPLYDHIYGSRGLRNKPARVSLLWAGAVSRTPKCFCVLKKIQEERELKILLFGRFSFRKMACLFAGWFVCSGAPAAAACGGSGALPRAGRAETGPGARGGAAPAFPGLAGPPPPPRAPGQLGPAPGPRTLATEARPAARSRRPWRVRGDGCACARGGAGASVGALESKGPEFEPRGLWGPLSDAQRPSSGVRLPPQSPGLARSVGGSPLRAPGLRTVPAPSVRAVPERLSLDETPQPRSVGGWVRAQGRDPGFWLPEVQPSPAAGASSEVGALSSSKSILTLHRLRDPDAVTLPPQPPFGPHP